MGVGDDHVIATLVDGYMLCVFYLLLLHFCAQCMHLVKNKHSI